MPLVDLCALGGWKDPQTVLKCYMKPDGETQRQALARRAPLGAGGAPRVARMDTPALFGKQKRLA